MQFVTIRTPAGYFAGRSIRTDRFGNEKPGRRIVTLSPVLAEEIALDDVLALREAILRLYQATGENPEGYKVEERVG